MFILITYDIENDKRRSKIAKTLEGHGERVQYSVFECNLRAPQFKALKKRLASLMDGVPENETCSIRFYRLCAGCIKNIEILGQGSVTRDQDFYIV